MPTGASSWLAGLVRDDVLINALTRPVPARTSSTFFFFNADADFHATV